VLQVTQIMQTWNADLPDGMLIQFVTREMEDYREPQRRGTPKGERIGFSQKKHLASLLSLTNLDLTVVAHKVDVSYGLLKKWRSEQEFKRQVKSHRQRFVAFLLERCRELRKLNDKEEKKFLGQSLRHVAKDPLPLHKSDNGDAAIYDPVFALEIRDTINKKKLAPLTEKPTDESVLDLMEAHFAMRKIVETSVGEETRVDIVKISKDTLNHFIYMLGKGAMTSEEQKTTLYMLRLVSGSE